MRYILTLALSAVVIGLTYQIQQPAPLPPVQPHATVSETIRDRDIVLYALDRDPVLARLEAAPAPLLASQAVDPQNPAHKVRPDGKACQATGKDACTCTVSSCSHDEQGHITSWHASSQCQWFCHQDKCTCHPCVEDGDCPDGSGGRGR